ncbi:hypothetical protein EVAR_18353_1 [Eumeta japonica]|uniref:Uncharacterized protein n=1 Tax=Eumeta variegata TaxID=151549 RepID=A0A4C1VAB7_EUMVA|nr:hypothetical protein EVAR_18353_1 [Eumeta japonica]
MSLSPIAGRVCCPSVALCSGERGSRDKSWEIPPDERGHFSYLNIRNDAINTRDRYNLIALSSGLRTSPAVRPRRVGHASAGLAAGRRRRYRGVTEGDFCLLSHRDATRRWTTDTWFRVVCLKPEGVGFDSGRGFSECLTQVKRHHSPRA